MVANINRLGTIRVKARELHYRLSKIDGIRRGLHPKQLAFVDDKSRRKAALCTRRSGKTHSIGADIVITSLKYPTDRMAYIGPTGKQAKMLVEVPLEETCREAEVKCKYRQQGNLFRFEHGGELLIVGADKRKDIEKLRGFKLRKVYIDESASFGHHIEELVFAVLQPALSDLNGSIVMVGTPGKKCAGAFYEICEMEYTKNIWSRHKWSVLDNRYFPMWRDEPDETWQEAAKAWLKSEREELGLTEDDPTWLREWQGAWVKDRNRLVYGDVNRELIYYTEGMLPSDDVFDFQGYQYVYGVDLGVKDDVAIEILAFSRYRPEVFEVYGFSKPGMDVTDIAVKLKELFKRWDPMKVLVDTGGLGLMVADELRKRHSIPCEGAKKTEKLAHIKLLNSDFRKGLVKVPEGSGIVNEWESIEWNEKMDGEDESFANHRADAFLYAWRHCLQYLSKERKPEPKPGTGEYYAQHAKEERKRRERQIARAKSRSSRWE